MKKTKNTKIRTLCEAAVMIALAEILSLIKIFDFPQGGAITIAMLPLVFYSYRWGTARGLLMTFAFSIVQLLIDHAYAWSWQSIVGDYIIAYTVLGFAGLFKGKKGGIFIGTTLACGLRFLCHYIVGATIWAEYMTEKFFGMTMTSPWIYSALYNGSYMLADYIILIVVFVVIKKPLNKWIEGMDLLENNK